MLGAEGPRSRLVPGSRPPSVEDVLQDGGCGESRSLTRSESDAPVDVFLPGNGRAIGAGAAAVAPGPGGLWSCAPQPWDGTGALLPGTRAPAPSQWAERAVGKGGLHRGNLAPPSLSSSLTLVSLSFPSFLLLGCNHSMAQFCVTKASCALLNVLLLLGEGGEPSGPAAGGLGQCCHSGEGPGVPCSEHARGTLHCPHL